MSQQERDHGNGSDAADDGDGDTGGVVLGGAPRIYGGAVRKIIDACKGVPLQHHHNGSTNAYMANKLIKLDMLKSLPAEEVLSSIFKNCTIFINGTTSTPHDELKLLFRRHGGEVNNHRSEQPSHFVCNYFNTQQINVHQREKRINSKKLYVTEHWITASVAARKRLSESAYCPEV